MNIDSRIRYKESAHTKLTFLIRGQAVPWVYLIFLKRLSDGAGG